MSFGGFGDLILGYPFLKKYQVVFNQNTKTIGFYLNYNEKKSNKNSKITIYIITISILSIVFISLLVSAILLYLKKKNNKKNATELIEK